MSRSHDAATPQLAWEAAGHYVGQALFLVRHEIHAQGEGWKGKIEKVHAELVGRLNILAWQMEKNRHYKDQQKLKDLVRFVTQNDMSNQNVCIEIEKKSEMFAPA